MISHDRYGLDHSQTAVFYRGDEAQMAFPKLYGQLIQTAHVHSFTMPLVFLSVWLALAFTPLSGALKKFLIAGGALSILIYNAAPFLVRYASERWVSLFTVGGIGLFVFFLVPTALALYETWLGFSPGRDRGGPWSKST
jgi:hypothetical protein